MNHPAMQGLNLATPGYVKNARLIAWPTCSPGLTPRPARRVQKDPAYVLIRPQGPPFLRFRPGICVAPP